MGRRNPGGNPARAGSPGFAELGFPGGSPGVKGEVCPSGEVGRCEGGRGEVGLVAAVPLGGLAGGGGGPGVRSAATVTVTHPPYTAAGAAAPVSSHADAADAAAAAAVSTTAAAHS